MGDHLDSCRVDGGRGAGITGQVKEKLAVISEQPPGVVTNLGDFIGALGVGTLSLLFHLFCKKHVQRCLQRQSGQTSVVM